MLYCIVPFNRTAYGIEISIQMSVVNPVHPSFNRTAYGIEIKDCLSIALYCERLLIAPLMELKCSPASVKLPGYAF